MKVLMSQLKVSKVLSDEGDRVVLEVGKTDKNVFDVEQGSVFYTLIFVKSDGEGNAEVWDPFADV